MDIVVKGRNVEVPDHYREHVADKLTKVERYDQKLIRADVELFHERNPRQSDICQRVEITVITRGPVIRAEACAKDFYAALDAAIGKLDTACAVPPTAVACTADVMPLSPWPPPPRPARRSTRASTSTDPSAPTGSVMVATAIVEHVEHDDDQPWRIVREKEHPADPMTVDDALFQMELVGHDFYLFQDKESGRPSVVYRRRGYDYGILSLANEH